jgi:hypothetical protein
MLLMTSNTRSGGVGQGRASFSAPRSGRSALTDAGAEGIRPRCPGPVFSTSSRAVTVTFTRQNREHADSPPTASFHSRSRTATCKHQPFRGFRL